MGKRHTPDVREPMFLIVPAAVRQVDPAHEGHRLVNDDNLLVVCPQVDRRGYMVWVTHNLKVNGDVAVQAGGGRMCDKSAGRGSNLDVGVKVPQRPLTVAGVDPQSQLHLLVQHHEYPHALLL